MSIGDDPIKDLGLKCSPHLRGWINGIAYFVLSRCIFGKYKNEIFYVDICRF